MPRTRQKALEFHSALRAAAGMPPRLLFTFYNNLYDVPAFNIACHSSVNADMCSMHIKICAWDIHSFIPCFFSEKIPFNAIHALLLMK